MLAVVNVRNSWILLSPQMSIADLEQLLAEKKDKERKVEESLRALGHAEAARRDELNKALGVGLLVKTQSNKNKNNEADDEEYEEENEPQENHDTWEGREETEDMSGGGRN